MNIAEQIKAFHTTTDKRNGAQTINIVELLAECEEKATETTQDWDNEQTEFDFADGSVLIVWRHASAYGSR
jgi:hypothetical protein